MRRKDPCSPKQPPPRLFRRQPSGVSRRAHNPAGSKVRAIQHSPIDALKKPGAAKDLLPPHDCPCGPADEVPGPDKQGGCAPHSLVPGSPSGSGAGRGRGEVSWATPDALGFFLLMHVLGSLKCRHYFEPLIMKKLGFQIHLHNHK